MTRRVVPSLPARIVLASVAMYACGPHARSAETERKKPVEGPPIAASLEVNVSSGVELAFRVTNNQARKVELMFPSGQTHDFVVLDSLGREVWRWSEGRMFTQAVQNRLLESSASISWQAVLRSTVAPGRYVAVASLLSENKPLEERVTFEVR